jgi:hypothetical protein
MLSIAVATGTDTELKIRERLNHLVSQYPIIDWLYTRTVIVDDGAIPHSHPILTIHTRHLGHDEALLSTYLHLIVCHLEHRAIRKLVGEPKAQELMKYWAGDHYLWVYRTVIEQEPLLTEIVNRHLLRPAGL